jgi:hypothetical protein
MPIPILDARQRAEGKQRKGVIGLKKEGGEQIPIVQMKDGKQESIPWPRRGLVSSQAEQFKGKDVVVTFEGDTATRVDLLG